MTSNQEISKISYEVQTDELPLCQKLKGSVYEKIENTTRCRLIQMVSIPEVWTLMCGKPRTKKI